MYLLYGEMKIVDNLSKVHVIFYFCSCSFGWLSRYKQLNVVSIIDNSLLSTLPHFCNITFQI